MIIFPLSTNQKRLFIAHVAGGDSTGGTGHSDYHQALEAQRHQPGVATVTMLSTDTKTASMYYAYIVQKVHTYIYIYILCVYCI